MTNTPNPGTAELPLSMQVTEWLRHSYGLDDDDELNAGEVEELVEAYHSHIAPKIAQQEFADLIKKKFALGAPGNLASFGASYLNEEIDALLGKDAE